MKFLAALHRRFHWLNLPGALLMMILQRTPLLNLLVTAETTVLRSPAGAVLKSSVAGLVALGALHSRAGATTLVTNQDSPLRATVGTRIAGVAFSITGTLTSPSRWSVSGALAPGLTLNGSPTVGNIPGDTLVLAGTPTTAGSYTFNFSGTSATGFTTPTYNYTVTASGGAALVAPAFTTQPATQTVTVGANVTFTVAADGAPAPTLQWRKNGTALTGQTSATLTLPNVQTADAGAYTCVATNSAGTATSNAATLTVNSAVVGTVPVIVTQPASTTAALGANVSFTVVATGATSQQWRKNGTAIAGATTTTLALNNLTASAAANYDVVLSNAIGATASATATLLLNAGLTARLSNVAVRTTLAANQILTVGLTVQGGAKPVLIRAAGPGLGALGVPGTMADPKLALFNGSTQEAANDNWAGDPAVSAAISAVGAFPFPGPTSLDAALVRSVDGGRTVQVSGPAAGNLIVEAYDAGSGNSPRLTNLSALNFVGTGDDVLIAGFTVSGSGTKNVLIRAAGPSLGALGVPGTLVDPKLELFTAANPAVKIGENDNYSASLPALFLSVGAFAFVPGAKDAALIVSLPPGGYTVQVSGADGGTGNAIVEVYELP